ALFLQFLLAAVGSDRFHQRGGIVVVEDFGLEAAHTAVMANHGRLADRDVQVGRLQLDNSGQQFVDYNRGSHEISPRRKYRVIWLGGLTRNTMRMSERSSLEGRRSPCRIIAPERALAKNQPTHGFA